MCIRDSDQSYKQDEGVTYNARDMAISRASFENIVLSFFGKIFFTSSDILSTPGPLKTKLHFPSFEQFLFNKVLYPQ